MNQVENTEIQEDTRVMVSRGFILDNFERRLAKDKNLLDKLKRYLAKKLLEALPVNQRKIALGRHNTDIDKFIKESSLEDLKKIINFSVFTDVELLDVMASLKGIPKRSKNIVTLKGFEDYDF